MSDRPSTALQHSLGAVFAALDAARGDLGRAEYQVLLDIVAVRLAHDYLARIGLLTREERRPAA